jgi:hypothetical protein
MIDPFTAFAMAQGAVKGIKSALQLGKDISSLYKEFGTFFQSADAVHVASVKMKMDSAGKSDAQIGAEALQIALASKALRDTEKQLKDMLYWSGNAPVWEEMMRERVRMIKARVAAELAIKQAAIKKKEDIANVVLNVILGLAFSGILSAVGAVALRHIVKH